MLTPERIKELSEQHLDASHQFGRLWIEGEEEFARAIEAEVRKDDEARIAEHEQALAFLAGLYCGDLTISEPPMTVAERIFDSVMAERAGLKAEIQQKEEALEFLRSAWNRARLEKAP